MSKARTEYHSSGLVIHADTTKELLAQAQAEIEKNGSVNSSQRGVTKSLRGVELVIHQPLVKEANFPYWTEDEDNWYQNNFVSKSTNLPPEDHTPGSLIFPYRYADRSRFYDSGLGYVTGVIELLSLFAIEKVDALADVEELKRFIIASYPHYHPERALAVLHWQGKGLLNRYLAEPWLLEQQLRANRADTLESLVAELKQSPTSRRAITPSFIYQPIDHSVVAGGIPPYQQYQVLIDTDARGNPTGFSSYHLHRSLDAYGGAQLDISHDRAWGEIVSRELGLPLNRIVVMANDMHHYTVGEQGNKDLVEKTNIRDWLFQVTDGYDPKREDIDKRLASPIYQSKIQAVIEKHFSAFSSV